MLDHTQIDFSGGMNLFDEDHAIGDDEYVSGFNVRNRASGLEVVNVPTLLNAPYGKKQGLYAFEDILVLFVNGSAYYTFHTDNTRTWTKINDFAMSINAQYIYVYPIPAATMLYERKLVSTTNIEGSASQAQYVNKSTLQVNGNEAGLLCQDGSSQPWLILPDGTARRTQTYYEWSAAEDGSREYVPIGRQMAMINGILFLISADGTKLYRSVSGRPLDFVVNVTATGDKGGDASTVEYAVSSSVVTCMKATSGGQLLIGTLNGCYPITLNYEKVIFQEPTFNNQNGFDAGIVNQFSVCDVLGDYVWIDTDGVRSFNAVSQLQNEGRNSIFSKRISRILTGIKQQNTCSIVFDNYTFMMLRSHYGYVVAVYDNTHERWISLDQYGISPIKMFAVAKQATSPTLLAITENEVYELFLPTAELADGRVVFGSKVSDNVANEMKLNAVYGVFNNSDDETYAECTELFNGSVGNTIRQELSDSFNGIPYPAIYPVLYAQGGTIDLIRFDFVSYSHAGWKIGTQLSWSNQAKLICVKTQYDTIASPTAMKQQAKVAMIA